MEWRLTLLSAITELGNNVLHGVIGLLFLIKPISGISSSSDSADLLDDSVDGLYNFCTSPILVDVLEPFSSVVSVIFSFGFFIFSLLTRGLILVAQAAFEFLAVSGSLRQFYWIF